MQKMVAINAKKQ